MVFRLIVAWYLIAGPIMAQQRFPMQEVDEIGHLNSEFDERKVADLGLAQAYPEDDGEALRIEGVDDAGKPWTAHMKNFGHVGWTRVFTADFDANGKRDLLFVQFFLGNGRCLDELVVTSFLFDEKGRPTPWRIVTHGFRDYDDGLLTLLDEDGDGKAELASCGCEYSDFPRNGEDRRLTGIYEAGDALWRPLQPLSVSPYVWRFQQERPHTGEFIVWEEPDAVWSDPTAGWNAEERHLQGISGTGRDAVLRFQDGSSSPIADGVVIDGPGGREIFLTETGPAYDRALAAGAAIRLLGDGERPALLWARVDQGDTSASLLARMKLSETETVKVRVEEGNASPPAPGAASGRRVSPSVFDRNTTAVAQRRAALISRDGRCYDIPGNVLAEGVVKALPDCGALGAQRSEAAQGQRVWVGGLGGVVWILNPEARSFKRGRWRIPGALMDFHTVEIQPLNDQPADLVSVIERGRGFMAQWRLGARSWLTLHDESGAPISPAIDPEREGELFLLDDNSGKLCFLRWDGDAPVELTCARARIELARDH